MKLESIGKVLASGFGDRVMIGILIGTLEKVTPERCYQYIKEDIKIGNWASDSDWQRFQRMAEGANVRDITTEDIIKELRKSNPEILGVIINHPEGRNWLDRQVTGVKKKLGLE